MTQFFFSLLNSRCFGLQCKYVHFYFLLPFQISKIICHLFRHISCSFLSLKAFLQVLSTIWVSDTAKICKEVIFGLIGFKFYFSIQSWNELREMGNFVLKSYQKLFLLVLLTRFIYKVCIFSDFQFTLADTQTKKSDFFPLDHSVDKQEYAYAYI